MSQELLPCPFCGHSAQLDSVGGYDHFVMCDGCCAESPRCQSPTGDGEAAKRRAVEYWNRRTPKATSLPSLSQHDPAALSNVDELVAPAAVRADEVDAEVVNAGLDGAEGNFCAATDADPHGGNLSKGVDLHDRSRADRVQVASAQQDERLSLRTAANLAYNALHECKPLKGAEQQVSDAIRALHEALKDIAYSTSLTATPKQFADHLQRTAREALGAIEHAPQGERELQRDAAVRTVRALGLHYTPGCDQWRPLRQQDERAAFEAEFPIPSDCIRCGDGYAATGYNAWDAQAHCHRWEGWIAARRAPLGGASHREEIAEVTEIIELMAADEEVDTVPKTALGQALKVQAGRLRERMREIAEVEYVLNCMDEGDRTGCGSKTDLGRDLEHQVQKLYEETDRVEEAQREVDSMRYQRDAWRADAERLDYLDRLNAGLNRHYGTDYGWQLILSPNIVRLMSGPGGRGHCAAIDLNESKARGAKSCRAVIDDAIKRSGEQKA